nr:MAG TPA: hypothetical protein [Caudoviricetes sp.]
MGTRHHFTKKIKKIAVSGTWLSRIIPNEDLILLWS